MKKERGITLIALVVTIIVLMILAGVAISLLAGDRSVMQGAQEASSEYSVGASNEKSLVDKLTNVLSENQAVLGDKTAPTATLNYSDAKATKFTLTATGEDGLGISKYEFYIDGKLYNAVTTSENVAICNVTEKTAGTAYKCKVRVYDIAGNSKDSEEITVTTIDVISISTLEVGHYIDYKAGSWTEDDFDLIENSLGNPTVNKSASKPGSQGQFGGFTLGQSRDTNSTPYSSAPKYSGWRVWDIDEETGEVTIISAGHPETYYHASGNSSKSVEILRNRDCSMYENEYAQAGSAHILTGQEAATWYNKTFSTEEKPLNYEIIENGGSSSSFYNKIFSTAEPISVLENGSYYWLASAYHADFLCCVNPSNRDVDSGIYAYRCPRINHFII